MERRRGAGLPCGCPRPGIRRLEYPRTNDLPAQTYPDFRSPYVGADSLPGTSRGRETWTTTAFIGLRLWEGGEIYFNPELAQGFGLAGALGLAGFSNGEAQKAGAPFPQFRPATVLLPPDLRSRRRAGNRRGGINQVAGERDIDRITLTIGRITIGDIFDAVPMRTTRAPIS